MNHNIQKVLVGVEELNARNKRELIRNINDIIKEGFKEGIVVEVSKLEINVITNITAIIRKYKYINIEKLMSDGI